MSFACYQLDIGQWFLVTGLCHSFTFSFFSGINKQKNSDKVKVKHQHQHQRKGGIRCVNERGHRLQSRGEERVA